MNTMFKSVLGPALLLIALAGCGLLEDAANAYAPSDGSESAYENDATRDDETSDETSEGSDDNASEPAPDPGVGTVTVDGVDIAVQSVERWFERDLAHLGTPDNPTPVNKHVFYVLNLESNALGLQTLYVQVNDDGTLTLDDLSAQGTAAAGTFTATDSQSDPTALTLTLTMDAPIELSGVGTISVELNEVAYLPAQRSRVQSILDGATRTSLNSFEWDPGTETYTITFEAINGVDVCEFQASATGWDASCYEDGNKASTELTHSYTLDGVEYAQFDHGGGYHSFHAQATEGDTSSDLHRWIFLIGYQPVTNVP